MNYVDLVVLGVTLVSVLIGILRGFVREMLSLASWILAFYVAFMFSDAAAIWFEGRIDTPALRVAAAFAVLFIAVLLLASVVSYLLYKLIPVRAIRGPDRALGAVFGFARAVVLVAAVVLLAGVTALPQESWWRESRLLPYAEPVAVMIADLLPEDVARELGHGPPLAAGEEATAIPEN